MPPSYSKLGGRPLALDVLERWEKGVASIDSLLDQVCAHAEPRERALAHELALGVLRWKSRLDELLQRLLRQPLSRLHPQLLLILRIGLYQLRHLDRIPARAVVYESVELARAAGLPWATGLINGVLRSYDRERAALEALPAGNQLDAVALRWAHPAWMVRLFKSIDPDGLEAWLESNNQVPPTVLRANTLRISRDALLKLLVEKGIDASFSRFAPDGIILRHAGSVAQLPGFSEGLFAVQDEASQLVTLLLDAQPGQRVLDACAAPGGKSLQLAAAVGPSGEVLATDLSQTRLQSVEENRDRLALPWIRCAVANWEQTPPTSDLVHEGFDRVLVDAPCSGLGVIRRIPEIKWRRKPEELERNASRQLEILGHAASVVRPGGVLVYSVCSPAPEEGREVVERFLQRQPDFQHADLRTRVGEALEVFLTPDGDLATFPHRHQCDGFFAARLERRGR